MFRPLSLLSHVPCPSLADEKECKLPRCLFSHQLPPRNGNSPIDNSRIVSVSLQESRGSLVGNTILEKGPSERLRKEEKRDEGGMVDPRLRALEEGKFVGNPSIAGNPDVPVEKSVVVSAMEGEKQVKEKGNKTVRTGQVNGTKRRKLDDGGYDGGSGDGDDMDDGGVKLALGKTSVAIDRGKKDATGSTVSTTITTKTAAVTMKRPAPGPAPRPSHPVSVLNVTVTRQTTSGSVTSTAKEGNEAGKPAALTPRPLPRTPAQHGVRYQLMMKLHEQLTRLNNNPKALSEKEAIIRKTLDIEEDIAKTKATAYRSAMGHLVMRLMKLTPAQYAAEQAAEEAKRLVSTTVEKPETASTLDNSAPPLKTGLTAADEIAEAQKLIHPIPILKQYEYTITPPTDAEISKAREGLEAAGGYETCERCSTRFCVFPGRRASDGALTTNGPCTYHPGRRFKSLKKGTSDWSCCSSVVGDSAGCASASSHVFKVSDAKRLAVTFPYITTPPNPNIKKIDEPKRAVALDAEMCYTTHGMEICRLSAVAFPSGEIIIDALVRPFGEVLDFNTRFSGITAEMLARATPWKSTPYPPLDSAIINPTTGSSPTLPQAETLSILPSPLAARDALLQYITTNTPLIGHSLSNDLNVLRLCHTAIVDTVIAFPHVKGLPLKNRLKWCVERFLKRQIQIEGEVAGHDSVVDARCAAELVRWKVKGVVRKRKA